MSIEGLLGIQGGSLGDSAARGSAFVQQYDLLATESLASASEHMTAVVWRSGGAATDLCKLGVLLSCFLVPPC